MEEPFLAPEEDEWRIPAQVLRQYLLAFMSVDLTGSVLCVGGQLLDCWQRGCYPLSRVGKAHWLVASAGTLAASCARLGTCAYGCRYSLVAMTSGLSSSVLALLWIDGPEAAPTPALGSPALWTLVAWSWVCSLAELGMAFVCLAAYKEQLLSGGISAGSRRATRSPEDDPLENAVLSQSDRFSGRLSATLCHCDSETTSHDQAAPLFEHDEKSDNPFFDKSASLGGKENPGSRADEEQPAERDAEDEPPRIRRSVRTTSSASTRDSAGVVEVVTIRGGGTLARVADEGNPFVDDPLAPRLLRYRGHMAVVRRRRKKSKKARDRAHSTQPLGNPRHHPALCQHRQSQPDARSVRDSPPSTAGVRDATALVRPAAGARGWKYARHLPSSVYAAVARAACYYVALAIAAVLFEDAFPTIERVVRWRGRVLYAFIAGAWIYSTLYFGLFLYAPWPRREQSERWSNDPDFLRRIGVVVPCHRSAAEIGETVSSLLKYFEAHHIVVCDNANADAPPDNTRAVIERVCLAWGLPRDAVHYMFIPEGLKTQALGVGALALAALGSVDYVLHIDDDTRLSESMVFDEGLFTADPTLCAVSFARTVAPANRVAAYVDFFYKRADHFGYVQSRLATRPYVPGPAGLWRLDVYLTMMTHHPSLPFGEDIFGSYHALLLGYRMHQELRCTVRTFAPPVLHEYSARLFAETFDNRQQGYGAASIWKQRAHRWTVSGMRILPLAFKAFFCYRAGSWTAALWFRLFRLREWKSLGFNLVTPLYLVYLLFAVGVLRTIVTVLAFKAFFFLLSILRNGFINYVCWRHRPDIQVHASVILLSPLMDAFTSYCAMFGRWKCILYYIPLVAMRTGLFSRLEVTVVDKKKRLPKRQLPATRPVVGGADAEIRLPTAALLRQVAHPPSGGDNTKEPPPYNFAP